MDSWPKKTQSFWINVHAVAALWHQFILCDRPLKRVWAVRAS